MPENNSKRATRGTSSPRTFGSCPGTVLRWNTPTNGDLIRFRIVEQGSTNGAMRAKPVKRVSEPEPEPEPEPVAPPKRKSGRPKKTMA
jgi:hypothetical protein